MEGLRRISSVALASASAAPAGGKPVNAPVAGTLLKYAVAEGSSVSEIQTINKDKLKIAIAIFLTLFYLSPA